MPMSKIPRNAGINRSSEELLSKVSSKVNQSNGAKKEKSVQTSIQTGDNTYFGAELTQELQQEVIEKTRLIYKVMQEIQGNKKGADTIKPMYKKDVQKNGDLFGG